MAKCRTCRLSVSVCLHVALVVATAGAQQPPQLTKDQRVLLQALVTAADAPPAPAADDPAPWRLDVLRASDGSHYLAVSVPASATHPIPAGPLLVYVRLSTAPAPGVATLAERSAVREWLQGARVDPRLQPRRGHVTGEMPAFGATAIAARSVGVPSGSMDLRLMEMERERSRQDKEERDKQRKAELEGTERARIDVLPFEDFDVVPATALADQTLAIQRALTAGPGEYRLSIGWVEAAAKPAAAAVRLVTHPVRLALASSTELALSSVIIADHVSARDVPYAATEQRAHPYAIGPTELVPARDTVLTRDERLNVVFQVINPRPTDTGKPDVTVNFRLVRMVDGREQPAAALTPQRYDANTLPADFDLRLGHPVIAAVSVPLATLARGDYRLKIAASDRVAGTAAPAETAFSVVGTPLSLLAEAPPLGLPFRRDAVLETAPLEAMLAGLRPETMSPALAQAFEVARARRWVDLVRDEALAPAEQGPRAGLTALAFYALGDPSAAVQVQRAIQLTASAAPLQVIVGAARALEGRDADALAAWRLAIDDGLPPAALAPVMAGAQLRRGDGRAVTSLLAPDGVAPADPALSRLLAAAYIASGRHADAVMLLDARLAANPDDADLSWLLTHALYASVVRAEGATPALVERFTSRAQAYVAAGGAHRALAEEWLKVAGARR